MPWSLVHKLYHDFNFIDPAVAWVPVEMTTAAPSTNCPTRVLSLVPLASPCPRLHMPEVAAWTKLFPLLNRQPVIHAYFALIFDVVNGLLYNLNFKFC